MPRLRHLIIWLLILWLPAQALAGQVRLCPHAAEQQQAASHHGQHQHDHHTHHPAPSAHEHHACPHCESQQGGVESLVENSASTSSLCDQCLCCQLGGGYAAISPIMTATPRIREHWTTPPTTGMHSHISHPLQRPPQSAV